MPTIERGNYEVVSSDDKSGRYYEKEEERGVDPSKCLPFEKDFTILLDR